MSDDGSVEAQNLRSSSSEEMIVPTFCEGRQAHHGTTALRLLVRGRPCPDSTIMKLSGDHGVPITMMKAQSIY